MRRNNFERLKKSFEGSFIEFSEREQWDWGYNRSTQVVFIGYREYPDSFKAWIFDYFFERVGYVVYSFSFWEILLLHEIGHHFTQAEDLKFYSHQHSSFNARWANYAYIPEDMYSQFWYEYRQIEEEKRADSWACEYMRRHLN